MKITLKAARVNAGLNQNDAASELGIHSCTLKNYEKGVNFPDVCIIEKMKALYGVGYDDIEWMVG